MYTRTRLRLTAWYGAALVVVLVAVCGSTYALVSRSLDDDITAAVAGASADLRAVGDDGLIPGSATLPQATPPAATGKDDDEHEDDDHHDDQKSGALLAALPSDVFYVIFAADGSIISNPRSVSLAGINTALLQADAEDDHWRDVRGKSQEFRLATYVLSSAQQGDYFLTVGHGLDARNRDLRRLAIVLLAGSGGGLALALVAGYWLSGRALTPIRESVEAQRRFVSDASHELRTPLAVIRANNELLARHLDEPVRANEEQVEAIEAESEHMSRLVEALLTLARADEGRLVVAHELVDLGEITGEVVRDMAPVASRKGIVLDRDISPALLEGDPQRLRQLVMILVDNALKYTPDGGSVVVQCGRTGRTVRLSVSDTGPGIDAHAQKRVFDRFARLDSARTRSESGGTGLGLAIAREIALAHHGDLTVESAAGTGSRFTFQAKGAT